MGAIGKSEYCYHNFGKIKQFDNASEFFLSAGRLSFPEFGELQIALTPASSGVLSHGLCSQNIRWPKN